MLLESAEPNTSEKPADCAAKPKQGRRLESPFALTVQRLQRRALYAVGVALIACFGGCSDDGGGDAVDDSATADASDAAGTIDLHFDPWIGEPAGASARYNFAGGSWYDTPFPSELRRRADGGIDLGGFPLPRKGAQDPLLLDYLAFGATHLDGFSIAPTIYVTFDAPLKGTGLPKPELSLNVNANVALIDVDDASPERGRRIPLRSTVTGATRGNLLAANLLMAQPTWGAALRPNTTYAFYLRRGLRDAAGQALAQPAALKNALAAALGWTDAPSDADEAKLATTLAPFAAALLDGTIGALPHDLAAVTVFRTGDPTAELTRTAAWLRKNATITAATGWKKIKDRPEYALYAGTYSAPNFQQGKPPYSTVGGDFVFDDAGDPVVQAIETGLRVAIAVPKLPPGAGLEVGGLLPVVLFSHGTGGSYLDMADGGKWEVAALLCAMGFAVIGIDQPLHGPRTPKTMGKEALYLASFNFFHPAAGRTVFRQSALDNVMLVEMLKQGALDIPTLTTGGKPVSLDANRMHFYGHSQGGIVGPLLASVEPNLRAIVRSGAGGDLSLTVVRRKDIINFPQLMINKLGLDEGELSEFHPAVSLIQTIVDAVDPLAYGRAVMTRPKGVRPPHVLLTEGLKDEATPAAASEALAVAMGLSVLAPEVERSEAMAALDVKVVSAPVSNNLEVGGEKVTALLRQVASGDHYVVFTRESVAKLARDFLVSVGNTGEAIVENSGL